MAKTTIRSIYRQSDMLEDQLSLWHFMKKKERVGFTQEVQALVVSARKSEGSSKSISTKTRLRNIIEIWEEFLSDIDNTSSRDLAVISEMNKTSPTPTENRAEESSMKDFIRGIWLNITHPFSQPLSPNKVNDNSPASMPHNPKLRAIYDELYGIVDSRGRTE